MGYRVGMDNRIAALLALLAGLCALLLALGFAFRGFPGGLVLVVFVLFALVSAWYGLVGSGVRRVAGFSGAVVALAVTMTFLVRNASELWQLLAVTFLALVSTAVARRAFRMKLPLPTVAPPVHPVLFFNPKSGGGKAEKFSLADQATARGIEAKQLTAGTDLEALVRKAVDDGADALAMAGGDGSQAIVAAIAAEFDLPYACIPAGTRNHFALDLGVDRDDVVGALDAFVEAGERRVDLAEVNGRTFVNNVSLGIYAVAVQRDGYREAKLKTLLETVPDVVGSEDGSLDLRWKSHSGRVHSSGAAILVSNNRYRLGGSIGSGTRPRIDDGLLGIVVLADPASSGRRIRRFQRPWRDWSAPRFEVASDTPVPAGIDGEAARLEPPLVFRIRPGVLRVRIARCHPGASPSAAIPEGLFPSIAALLRIAAGMPPASTPRDALKNGSKAGG